MQEEKQPPVNDTLDEDASILDTDQGAAERSSIVKAARKPISLLKILSIALVSAILVVSLVLNASLLTTSEDSSIATPSFYWSVIIALLFITAISLGISFWLYYVRSIYLRDGPALVPEKWGMFLAELGHITQENGSNIGEALQSLIYESRHQTQKSESLLESFLTLQQVISNRDEEISRLKKGHDAKVFKRFVARFIRVSAAMEEIRSEAESSDQFKNYTYLCRLIQSALEECGVEQISPEINSDFRTLGIEVDDDPKIINTEDEALNFLVASVESPAYVIEGEGEKQIIIPSRVIIYRTQEKKESRNHD